MTIRTIHGSDVEDKGKININELYRKEIRKTRLIKRHTFSDV